jgi:hypothetical protein
MDFPSFLQRQKRFILKLETTTPGIWNPIPGVVSCTDVLFQSALWGWAFVCGLTANARCPSKFRDGAGGG